MIYVRRRVSVMNLGAFLLKIVYLYDSNQNSTVMEKKIAKIIRLVIMAIALVALIVFLVIHISAGILTQMSKIYLGVYILLILWAAVRVFTMTKDLLQK